MTTSVYNSVSVVGIEPDTITPLNNRAKLDTGTLCNYRCDFCYYKNQLDVNTNLEIIKNRIDYLIECGIAEVDLSGGESSVHKNWFDILEYCKTKNLRVSCLSNGYKFADETFLIKSVNCGLREILFSVHGYDETSHDRLVGKKNAFKRMMLAINNAIKHGVIIRINCTVTHDNFRHLDQFVNRINAINPAQVNLLPLNYWNDATQQHTIDYNIVAPYIHKAIDQLTVAEINVRYIPFCFMKGYEKHVVGYYQHIYDVRDWNIAVYDNTLDPEHYTRNRLKYMYEAAKKNRIITYYKLKECMNCKFFYICDGVEKQIKNIVLHPEPGDRITNVNWYRSEY